MENRIEFFDHRSKNSKFTSWILVASSLFSFSIFAPVVYTLVTEENMDPIFLFVFLPVFFAFSLLPIFLIKLTTGKSKKTIFETSLKKIFFHEGKQLIEEMSFSEIESLKQSRYTYTVKSKNGSRTVVVYTTVSPTHGDKVLAESTNFFQSRTQAEKIAKILHLPLVSEQGEKREPAELDLPFHKRPHPDFDSFSVPNFSEGSDLHWEDTGTEYKIISTYNPILLRIIGVIFSFVLFIILNLAIGDILGLGIFSWESFPPSVAEGIFVLIATALSLLPVGLAFYHAYKKKELKVSNEGVHKDSDFISFSSLEEVLIDENHLYLISDEKNIKISLYLFCKNEDYYLVKNALVYGILSKTNGSGSASFNRFTTEF